MAASPWTYISLAICLMVAVSVSSGSFVPQDGMNTNHRVARQIPADVQQKAEAAKQTFHDAAAAGAQRAQDLASSARAHLSQRVRRAADYYRYGPAGQRMGARYDARRWGASYGRNKRDDLYLERREEIARERQERRREREEREREREHEREREMEERRRRRNFREEY